ncbi:MAG: YlxR family protein [Thermoflexus sp.]|nr:YlxR family protein [Thermoflexus sp.]
MVRKHIPQRTCVGCRQVQAKREMIRIVRTLEGRVEIDPTGKKSGRGAYLHPRRSCWERALKDGRLEYALRMEALREEDQMALRAYASTLPEDEA